MLKGMTLGLAALLAAAAFPARAAEVLRVPADGVVTLDLGQAPGTILVANPAVADVVPAGGHRLIVLGRRPGQTGLVVLSAGGRQLLARTVTVVAAGGTVTVHRGAEGKVLSCTPACAEAAPPTVPGE